MCECGGAMYEGTCDECGYKGGDMDEDSQLVGNQKNIDVAEPLGKITADDFKKLRSGKTQNKHNVEEGIYDVEDINNKNEFDYVEEQNGDNEKTCKYHIEKFGEDDPVTQEMCKGVNLTEALKGRQRKLDRNKNNKIDAEDFKMLRKGETKESKEKKGTEGSFKRYCGGEVTKSCIDKALQSGSSSLVKKATISKNKKKLKESYQLNQDEMIRLIEKIVTEQKEKNNIKGVGGSPKGLEVYNKVHKQDGKENNDYIKDVAKKMKDYLKDGSKGEYSTEPKIFPKGNGELEKMSKKAYVPSKAVEDYTDNLTAAGQENLMYDEINPNEEWITDNIEGSSRTGNNPEWANTGESDVNKKRNTIRKKNILGQIKKKAYNKAPQPIVSDKTGEDEGSKIMAKLESTELKKSKQINEEFERMKSLIGYSQKTQ